MSTVERAVKMLKRNKRESLAYVATLSISTCLLFLFVNIQRDTNFIAQTASMNQAGKDMNNMIGGVLTLIIITVCFANTFIVNNYFNRAKAQELCVYLSCGMNVTALTKYLLVQNFILLFFSVCSGGILGCILHIGLNAMINVLLGLHNSLITLSMQGILMWMVILSVELIYLVLMNVGYAYKAELKDLLIEARTMRSQDFRKFHIPATAYILFSIIGLVILFFCNTDLSYLSVGAGIGIIGIHGFLHKGYPDLIEKNKRKHKHVSFVNMMVQGNFLELLNNNYLYIILVMCSVIVMCCIQPVVQKFSYLLILTCTAYLLVLIVMAISIIFKVMVASNKRKEEFEMLTLLGAKHEEIHKCIQKELYQLFACILFLPLIYAVVVCFRLLQSGTITIQMVSLILGSYLVILIITAIISKRMYIKNALFKEENDNELCD